MRDQLLKMLRQLHPSDAIALVESIGKQIRRENSIRINQGIPVAYIELERPDLDILKSN